MSKSFHISKRAYWGLIAVCFALGLLAGLFFSKLWLDKWVGINL